MANVAPSTETLGRYSVCILQRHHVACKWTISRSWIQNTWNHRYENGHRKNTVQRARARDGTFLPTVNGSWSWRVELRA
jgi:hypothetical protein